MPTFTTDELITENHDAPVKKMIALRSAWAESTQVRAARDRGLPPLSGVRNDSDNGSVATFHTKGLQADKEKIHVYSSSILAFACTHENTWLHDRVILSNSKQCH